MKFKCVHTGLVYEYSLEQDIKEMLKHEEYLVIEDEPVAEKPIKQAKKKETE